MIRRLLFKLARSRISAVFIGGAFTYLTPLMPLKRRLDVPTLIIFAHPVPFWPQHWLAVPKFSASNFLSLDWTSPDGRAWLLLLVRVIQPLVDVTLLQINGGAYQDVPQLHVHLAAARSSLSPAPLGRLVATLGMAEGYEMEGEPGQPNWLLRSPTAVSSLRQLDLTDPAISTALPDLFSLAQQMVRQEQLCAYTVQIDPDQTPLTLHLHGKRS